MSIDQTKLASAIAEIRRKKAITPENLLETMFSLMSDQVNAFMVDQKTKNDAREAERDAEHKKKIDELARATENAKASADTSLKRHIEARAIEIKGQKGEKGDKGEPGKSIKGPQGLQGKPGKSIQGKPGKPGKDGSPDAPDVVVEKVVKSRKKIPMEKIDGLPQTLTEVRRMVREKGGGKGSGGGMGNIVPYHVSVSSVTTSVQTPSKVAAGGYAEWVYYNGQFIARGIDYTLSSDLRTHNLLFTPQDGSVVDIIYVRTA